MKALVFSDTHGRVNKAVEIIESHKNVDLIIHLGDLVKDAKELEIIFNHKPIEYIRGNNDFYSIVPDEKIIVFGSKKILITHGHKYRVKYGYHEILTKGKNEKVDCVLFGHTHLAFEDIVDGILYLNPGSLTLPNDGPSYGIIEVNGDKLNHMICKLQKIR